MRVNRRRALKGFIAGLLGIFLGKSAEANTKPKATRKEEYVKYITKMFEENFNPETDSFEFLGLFESRVIIRPDMFLEIDGCTNVFIEIYPQNGNGCSGSASIRANNYRRPKQEWDRRNNNHQVKHRKRQMIWMKEQGMTAVNHCLPEGDDRII